MVDQLCVKPIKKTDDYNIETKTNCPHLSSKHINEYMVEKISKTKWKYYVCK